MSVWQPWREALISMTRYDGEDEVHTPLATLPVIILALDPGVANLGYALVRYDGVGFALLASGTLRNTGVDHAAAIVRALPEVRLAMEGDVPLVTIVELQVVAMNG
eukprot:7383286-Prymnesium_polylepis.1